MKRLICCLDGTWNDDRKGSSRTNVAKLYANLLPEDRNGHRQIASYIEGIATTEGQRAQFLRGAVGLEVADRIQRGFRFLAANYVPGDEIYLFGFSRGAFEARSLASLITLFGLPHRGTPFNLADAWQLYRQSPKKRDFDAVARLSTDCHYPVPIRCIGAWDTVGNLGNPMLPNGLISRRSHFHDMRLHDTIAVALHALSIDEQRAAMSPTLWTRPAGAAPLPGQYVEQTWFAGTHADVGGGWPEAGLSDISLHWMAERVSTLTGLAIDFDRLRMSTHPDPKSVQHNSTQGAFYALDRWVPYIRLVNQKAERAVSTLRIMTIGMHRTNELTRSKSINEGVHESVLRRFGRIVTERSGTAAREFVYMPRYLVAAIGEPATIEKPKPAAVPVSAVPPPCLPPEPDEPPPIEPTSKPDVRTRPEMRSMPAPRAMATASALASAGFAGQSPAVAKTPQAPLAHKPDS